MAARGKLIVFEGTDGSGKSTQMRLLGDYLKEKGVECYFTHEPTASPFGQQLRDCMSGKLDADERTIALLFAADRIDHITRPVDGMLAKLEAGVTVLCDRYYLSSFAYNGGFVSLEWVMELNRPAREILKSDLTVFLDVSPEESMKRVSAREERERYETTERQIKIRNKYFEVFEMLKDENVAVVKSENGIEGTQKEIRKIVDGLFGF